ncbi:MAG: PAS domain S-box protein [Desulfobacterales bacterium]|nr:PAS domain S-box protein [Desulfobacterales bacterium]MCP4161327.1 PAS domain S-box protein [Deltaproteobacteria bacterium]
MQSENRIDIRNSIATKLLKIVFGLYLIIAIGITLGHMVIEYHYQKKNIMHDLEKIQKTFEQSFAIDMWQWNHEALRSSVRGILEIPVIVGVKVKNTEGKNLAAGGVIIQDRKILNVSQQVNLFGFNNEELLINGDEVQKFEVFMHKFPIKYSYDGNLIQLGEATIYSSSSVIFRTVKMGFLMLVINAVLKTLALWFIFLWFSTFLLRRPLTSLASAVKNVSLENLDSFRVNIKTSGKNELKLIENSFNSMIINLHNSMVEQNRAEEALHDREAHLRVLIETIPDLIWVKDKDGIYISCNRKFESLFDAKEEQIKGKTDYDFYDKKKADVFRENDKTAIETGGSHINEEEVIYMSDGHKELLETIKTPMFNQDGELLGVLGVARDITERKQAEYRIAQEKEQLLVTLRSIGDGVITTSISGEIDLINKVAETITGWTYKEAHGKDVMEVFNIINAQTRKECKNPVQKVLEAKTIVGLSNNTVLIARDGAEIMIADSSAPIFDVNYEILGVVIVFRDVTEKHKIESQLQQSQKMEAIGTLAGGIAHDFNNMLGVITGNISYAITILNKDDELYEVLSDVQKSTKHAQSLTQQLLTFSKGGVPIKKASDINRLINESAIFSMRGSKANCIFDFSNDLSTAEIDEGQINQVIGNLIINANHAMPNGGSINILTENTEIESESILPLSAGQYIKIVVADKGIGISQKNLQYIFEPYYTTKQKGNGLGLATAYSIIKSHGGHITVSSEIDKGTVFSIYLPASSKGIIEVEDKEERKHTGQGKILIMDDQKSILKMVERMLGKMGYKVVSVTDGTQVIKLYREAYKSDKHFDLVILDLTVPGGTGGAKTIQELLKIDPKVKAVVSSGYSNDPIMANYESYGFCGVVPKPYTIDLLTEVLYKILDVK